MCAWVHCTDFAVVYKGAWVRNGQVSLLCSPDARNDGLSGGSHEAKCEKSEGPPYDGGADKVRPRPRPPRIGLTCPRCVPLLNVSTSPQYV